MRPPPRRPSLALGGGSASWLAVVLLAGVLLVSVAYFIRFNVGDLDALTGRTSVDIATNMTHWDMDGHSTNGENISANSTKVDALTGGTSVNMATNMTHRDMDGHSGEVDTLTDGTSVDMATNMTHRDMDGHSTDGELSAPLPSPPLPPICDLSDSRYDICDIAGDARTIGGAAAIVYVPPPSLHPNPTPQNWTVRAQSSKTSPVKEVTVRVLTTPPPPPCTVDRSSASPPAAIVFSLGGFTGDTYHDFRDVLVPLFVTAAEFHGDVQLVVAGAQTWFLDRYAPVFRNLSRHAVVDFDADVETRCYRRVIVGLRSHRDLAVDAARMPSGYDAGSFHSFLRSAYALPPPEMLTSDRKPKLMLIQRTEGRRFENEDVLAGAIENAGFEVQWFNRTASTAETAMSVGSCDVLMGAHGADLANFFFLRRGAVVLQVVHYGGMERVSDKLYGEPAEAIGLRHLKYSITAAESTLADTYGGDDPVVADPRSVHWKGWKVAMKVYWMEQRLRMNVTRFAPVLAKAMAMVKQQQ